MTPLIIAMLTAIVQGLPEIETAVAALIRMSQGQPLRETEMAALGAAMEDAHRRAQGEAPAA